MAVPGQHGEAAVSDVDELYRLFSGQLLRIVRHGVRAPDVVIEDACQLAWTRLVRHRECVQRENVLSWLVSTAVHDAVKAVRRAGRDVSLEAVTERGTDVASLRLSRAPEKLVEDRERLGSLRSLPHRQRTILWLYGLGLSYEEIARREGSTARAVERQLQRAREALRDPKSAIRLGDRRPGRGSARLAGAAPARAAAR